MNNTSQWHFDLITYDRSRIPYLPCRLCGMLTQMFTSINGRMHPCCSAVCAIKISKVGDWLELAKMVESLEDEP